MNPYAMFARLTAADMVVPSVARRVADRHRFVSGIARYVQMGDNDLYRATEVCLRNLERLDDEGEHPDSDLRLVLVPELWERIRSGSRDPLRRISSSLAEYRGDGPRLFPSMLSDQDLARLRASADGLRRRVSAVADLDAAGLVERVRFAIARSRVAERWPPDYPVYEPGFTYQLVPAVAWRMLSADRVELAVRAFE